MVCNIRACSDKFRNIFWGKVYTEMQRRPLLSEEVVVWGWGTWLGPPGLSHQGPWGVTCIWLGFGWCFDARFCTKTRHPAMVQRPLQTRVWAGGRLPIMTTDGVLRTQLWKARTVQSHFHQLWQERDIPFFMDNFQLILDQILQVLSHYWT